jgi:Recombinase
VLIGPGLTAEATRAEAARYAENTLPIIRQIEASGVKGLRAIARALEARGVPTARGGRWTPVQVSNLLRRAQGGKP